MFKAISNPSYSKEELARALDCSIVGDSTGDIIEIQSLDNTHEQALSFYSGNSKTALATLLKTKRPGLLLSKVADENSRISTILVKDPLAALLILIPYFYDKIQIEATISPKAEIADSATIAEGVFIGAFSVIGERCQIDRNVVIHPQVILYPDVKIGRDTIIHAGAVIREGVRIESGCVVHSGCILGADGFGYIAGATGLQAVPQLGQVILHSNVEVGANTCIDRGTIGNTIIGRGSKLDNLVQVGHNVRIGENSILCGQVGVAGSVHIGNRVVLGGNVGIADHLSISDDTRFASRSGVVTDIEEKGDYAGHPAVKATSWRRQVATLRKLPSLLSKLSKLT